MNDILIRKATLEDLESVLILFYKLSISDSPYDKDVDLNWEKQMVAKNILKKK